MAATDRVSGVVGNEAFKAPVVAATTGNITLSGTQTIDTLNVVADDRVLVKDQDTGSENGIYLVKTSTWKRASDWDGARDVLQGTLVAVTKGGAAGTIWQVDTNNPIAIGSTSITFSALTTLTFPSFIDTLLDDTTAAAFRTTLGLGDMAVQNKAAVNIDGGNIVGIDDLAIVDGGTGLSAAPIFSAYVGTERAIASDTFVKVDYDTELFDIGGYFDVDLARYLPLIAGYYQFNWRVSSIASTTLTRCLSSLYKNGVSTHRGEDITQTGFGSCASVLVSLNGSTDYVEIFTFMTATSSDIDDGSSLSFFQGNFIRGL